MIQSDSQNCFYLSNLNADSISLETYHDKNIAYYFKKNQFGLNTIADSTIDIITINGVTSGINLIGNVSIDTLNIFNHCNFFTNQNTTSINITSATIKLIDHTCFSNWYGAARQFYCI